MKHAAIFASGEGTNAQHIIDHFMETDLKISLIVCNNPAANVIKRAARHQVPVLLVDKEGLYQGDGVLKKLADEKIDLIICAGFLWKIPDPILHAYPNRVINIHPALLPKFGGKGMYGSRVHQAVIAAGEKESGITIHYVNEHYDEGKIILQKKCEVSANDTPEILAQKVHVLEHAWYPVTIEKILTKL